MNNLTIKHMSAAGMIAGIFIFGCMPSASENKVTDTLKTDQDYVLEGKHLVLVGGCQDCHSPKTFVDGVMGFDETRYLAGHPEGSQLPPLELKSLEPGNWLTFAPDLTAFVGPWGISYARNLTPHETGIKGWSLEVFVKAMRTGMHMGVEQGRPIMPPMPWQILSEMSDDELKAIYMYLMSIPPIDNHVPDPVSPDNVREMASS